MQRNQITLFNNFFESCQDALYLGDDLAIHSYSESLEKSVPGLTYAVFVDHSRSGIKLGGIESLQRFKRRVPQCPEWSPPITHKKPFHRDLKMETERWRFYCKELSLTNIRGNQSVGTVFVGFNLDILESELASIFERMWVILMWSVMLVLTLGLVLSFVLAGKLTKPIQDLTHGAKSIGEGNLDTQIPIETTDELGFLAQEFNWMAIKLKELDQLKDDFVSSVSHELRSPLSAISGYVELLRNKPLSDIPPDKREKALGIIHESTSRLTHFINDILDLAKLKSGHMDIRQQPFDLKETSEDVLTLFHPILEKKQIKSEMEIDESIPVITADDDKIRQVITNLVSNALKFTPSGGIIKIRAKNHTEFIQVTVEDSGIGVPPESLQLVFERFRQVQESRDRVKGAKGTGLGLAIAKGIIEAHGGRIWMESEVKKGTQVHFTLPNRPAPSL
jgi:signal transduction histidine kinase